MGPSRHPLNASNGEEGTAPPLIQYVITATRHGTWSYWRDKKDRNDVTIQVKQIHSGVSKPLQHLHLFQYRNIFVQRFSRLTFALYSSVKRKGLLSQMTNLNKLFCSALKCQFEKRNTHMLRQIYLTVRKVNFQTVHSPMSVKVLWK